MESTQNKLYEIEESAFVDQNNLKNNIIDEDLIGEENKNDYDVYADQFDDGGVMGAGGKAKTDGGSSQMPGGSGAGVPKSMEAVGHIAGQVKPGTSGV